MYFADTPKTGPVPSESSLRVLDRLLRVEAHSGRSRRSAVREAAVTCPDCTAALSAACSRSPGRGRRAVGRGRAGAEQRRYERLPPHPPGQPRRVPGQGPGGRASADRPGAPVRHAEGRVRRLDGDDGPAGPGLPLLLAGHRRRPRGGSRQRVLLRHRPHVERRRDPRSRRRLLHGQGRAARRHPVEPYFSKVTGSWRRLLVYTPPGYDERHGRRVPRPLHPARRRRGRDRLGHAGPERT